MSEYASNTPVSRPINLSPSVIPTHDFNGIMWNEDIGFMFAPQTESLPFRPPNPTSLQ